MPFATFSRPLQAIAGALALVAGLYVASYVVLGVVHLRYPYELEWMEGGMVDHVRRVLEGKPLYVAPSLEFVPFIYAPLYYYVSAAFAAVLGIGFFPLRLVSFAASLGCAALVFALVRREGGSRSAGALGAAAFLACYREASAFYDIARVDSLALVLFLGALYLVRAGERRVHMLGAATAFALAFQAKQSLLVAALPVLIFVAIRHRLRGVAFTVLPALAMMGLSALALDALTGGYYAYYVFWLPRQHPTVWRMLTEFWTRDMAPVGVALLFSLFFLCTGRAGADRSGRWFLAAALSGVLGVSWLGRLHSGGWPNVIMPAFALIAVLFALGLHRALELADGAEPRLRSRLGAFALTAALVQLLYLGYDPRKLFPSAEDELAGAQLIERLRSLDGRVFLPAHGHLLSLAGKPVHAHEMAIHDALGHGKPGKALKAELASALGERRFDHIVVSTDWYKRELARTYKRDGEIFTEKNVFYPVTGMRTRPKAILRPNEP